MRPNVWFISALAALAGGLSSYALMQGRPSASVPPVSVLPEPTALHLGMPVPSFVLADLDDQPVYFPEQFKGKNVLINIWASWCAPCVEEIPELARFAAHQGESGVQVVGIALDHKPAVRDFMQRISVPYWVALDLPGANDASVQLGNSQGLLPYSVLIDQHGRLVKQKLGPFKPGEVEHWATLAANNE